MFIIAIYDEKRGLGFLQRFEKPRYARTADHRRMRTTLSATLAATYQTEAAAIRNAERVAARTVGAYGSNETSVQIVRVDAQFLRGVL